MATITNTMAMTMYLPLATASIDFEHVIVDGSEDRAVLASCSEPYRSAIVQAVNCHDDLVAALSTLCAPDVSYHDGEIRIPLASHGAALTAMRVAREALAKAVG